jgi:hypothetical protein
MMMTVRKALRTVLPAAVAALALLPAAAFADDTPMTRSTSGEPPLAAMLNAGTALTGIGPAGQVGVLVPGMGAEVAGVQSALDVDGGGYAAGTVGISAAPARAALLNAGTAWTGLGRSGHIGEGIVAVVTFDSVSTG